MACVNNTLFNNYYVPDIDTQINEVLWSLGLPGAHESVAETGFM